ncbi:hypothetical protein ABZS66_09590 [Dactylosporangium sp. NPDC005572]|uniref:hypothetical protein n=1 Tax=Dactylosporangium sp. NPDC005572 TaxID=3156889 RepID=UPI0033BDF0F1
MSDTSGSNGSTPSDDALEAIVTAWREPATGAIAGRAVVSGGVNGAAGSRGRAEVRSPFSDMLAPVSPPVSAPPPVQPSTSTLHYGHYGPDGQGWPTSTHAGEPPQALQAAPGTVYGAQPPAEPQRPVSPAPYEQPYEQPHQQQPHQAYEQQPHQAYEQQPHQPHQAYEQHQQHQQHQQAYEQPHQQAYEQPHQPVYQQPYQHQAYHPQAYEQQARDDWAAYQEQQYQEQQAPQLQPQWGPPQQQPQQPEDFDWAAAPSQPLPAQRAPADDPLVGPLPAQLLGSGTQMAAEPAMPSLADALPTPAYDPPELPQRVPSQPDVPQVPETEPVMSEAGAPDLARIATYLREDEDEEPSPDGRPDGFDIPAVLRAVQGVSGVREATVRKNPDGVHTLRLELLDEADPGQVSRAVARLLNERMGLAAEPNLPGLFAPAPEPAPPRPPVRNTTNAPHSALPGYGREARRRRPVSGVRRGAEVVPAEQAQPVLVGPQPASAISSARVVIDSVDVNTQGIDAMVEVRLIADGQPAVGVASGPNVDGYMLRLAAAAAGSAVDQLLIDADGTARGRCYIEHAAVVPMGGCEVAVVVLLLMYDGAVEQLTGSAVVTGDPRQAVVRGTLAAVNRRLEALLP